MTFMNDEDKKRLSEWYGQSARCNARDTRCEDAAQTPVQPHEERRCGYSEPFWSFDGQENDVPRKRRPHTAAIAGGICCLAVVVIAATALLFSQNGSPGKAAGTDAPREPGSMEEFFENYYEGSETSTWFSDMPLADTGTGVTLTLTPRPEGREPMSLSEVYDRCAKSVVAITTEHGGGKGSWGSGMIMTADGYIITNAHVLDNAHNATVTLWDNREFKAMLVGADSASDVAVIKIDAMDLPAIEFCGSQPIVGEDVAAIGNPLGEQLRGTMTDGIISAISRDITYTSHPMTLIQTNAAINDGNSGGPLLNMYGQVVGMTSMKLISSYGTLSIEGIGFAIPCDTIKAIADQLIENGRVLGRPALGITVGAIPAEALDYFDIPDGLYVNAVAPGSDAADRIRVGDVITAVNGDKVSSTAALSAVLDQLNVGDSITLTVFRGGSEFDVEVKLVEFSDLY